MRFTQEYASKSRNKERMQNIVLDLGSHSIKAGIAGEDAPQVVMRTIVGRSKFEMMGLKSVEVGDEVLPRMGVYKTTYPVQRGYIVNYDDAELLIRRVYRDLQVAEEETGVVLLEQPHVPLHVREKQAQIFFETFNVRSMCAVSSAAMALLAEGEETGISVGIGGASSWIAPVVSGQSISSATVSFMITPEDMFSYVHRHVPSLTGTTKERERLSRAAEALAYVSPERYGYHDLKQKYQNTKEEEIPSKTWGEGEEGKEKIVLNDIVLCGAGETLFNPSLVGFSAYGLSDSCYEAWKRYQSRAKELGTQPMEKPSFFLWGGGSLIPGLSERLHLELSSLYGPNVELSIKSGCARKYASWIGASIFASSHPSFPSSSFTIAEYDEFGPSIINTRCP